MSLKSRFSKVIGVGGLGSGVLYQLEGDQDFGRNESRMAHRLPTRDFCKQHIILHYVTAVLRDLRAEVRILPVGGVGDDEAGRRVKALMQATGMDVRYVLVHKDAPTLFSICFLYADHSGGNLTESRSASSKVSAALVSRAEKEFRQSSARCLVLSAPEAPLPARTKLLALGRKHGAFNVASFVSGEMREVRNQGLLRLVDLLALNLDEAAQLASLSSRAKPERIVEACILRATAANPSVRLSITDGAHGSYSYESGARHFLPALKVAVKSTAGAGDAFLSGLILGTICGLPFHGDAPVTCARVGRLISAMSVTSADTINFGVTLATLKAFAKKCGEGALPEALRHQIAGTR